LQKSWVLKAFDSVMSAGCLLDLGFEAEVYHFWRPRLACIRESDHCHQDILRCFN